MYQTITKSEVETTSLFDNSITDNDYYVNFSTALCGEDTLRALGDEGADFVKLLSAKKPYKKGWNLPEKGHSAEEITRYLTSFPERYAGLRCGVTAIVVVDIDFDYQTQKERLGDAAHTWESFRPEAPDRGALIYRIDGDVPRTQSFTPKDENGKRLQDSPTAESKGLNRNGTAPHKTVVGGTYLLNVEHELKTITPVELNAIWFLLIGQFLREFQIKERQESRKKSTPNLECLTSWQVAEADPNLPPIQKIKTSVPVLKVFSSFGLADDIQEPDANGWQRLAGHSGLFVNQHTNHWFCHSEDQGGDVLDAWAWCKGYLPTEHGRIIREMCDAFGIEYQTPNTITIEGHEILVQDALNACLAEVAQLEAYARQAENVRSIIRGVIAILLKQDAIEGPASQRLICDYSGMSRPTFQKWCADTLDFLTVDKTDKTHIWGINGQFLSKVVQNRVLCKDICPNNTYDRYIGMFGQESLHRKNNTHEPILKTSNLQRDIFQRASVPKQFRRSVKHRKNGEWIEDTSKEARLNGLGQLMNAQVEDNTDKLLKPLGKHGLRLIELLDTGGPMAINELTEALSVSRQTVSSIVKRATTDIEKLAKRLGREDIKPLFVVERIGRGKKYLSLPEDFLDRLAKVEEYLVNDGQDARRKKRHNDERIAYLRQRLENTETDELREDLEARLESALEWGRVLTKEKGA